MIIITIKEKWYATNPVLEPISSSWSSPQSIISIRTCDFKKRGKALWTHVFSPNWDLIHVTSTHLHHRHTTTTNQNKHVQITKSGWVATPSSRSSRILDYRCICPAATACEAVLGWWVLMLQQWGKLSWNLWNIYVYIMAHDELIRPHSARLNCDLAH